MTVNCRRSASADLRSGTDWAGAGKDIGVERWEPAGAVSAVPHSRQNFVAGRFTKPHWEQERWRGAPHFPQKLMPSGFSNPQLAHCMLPLYSFRFMRARKTLGKHGLTTPGRLPDNRRHVRGERQHQAR